MSSRISNSALVDRVMRWLTSDVVQDKELRYIAREAIRAADDQIRHVDEFSPLAWHIGYWDALRTVPYATISAITQADPGVITAANSDSNITGHGFPDNSSNHQAIVLIDSIDATDGTDCMEILNERFYLVEYVSATTFSLKTIDNLDAVDTSGMTAYVDGGNVYHAGWKLDTSLITANVSNEWSFGEILPYGLTVDGYPCRPVGMFDPGNRYELRSTSYARRPPHYYYWQHHETYAVASPTVGHYLFLLPPANTYYNVQFKYRKEIDEIGTWTTNAYPPHPAEVHSALWKGALAHLVGNSKRVERQAKGENSATIATQMEVLHAQHWLDEWAKARLRVFNFHRKLLGEKGGMGGIKA